MYEFLDVPKDNSRIHMSCPHAQVQFSENGGRCGLCGDNWAKATPRPHELGGKYGQGVIVKSYTAGGLLPVSVQLTANHLGKFVFKLCNLDANAGVESDECFEQNALPLQDGSGEYALASSEPGWYNVVLQLPAGLRCERCVLQWTYVAGNNWGYCGNGTGRLGCGPQEHFRSCSDIRIK